jgi:uncharacterized protein
MTDFLTAIALVLVLEGTAYALFPGAIKRMMAAVIEQPERSMRSLGLISAGIGVVLVWLIRN